MCLRILGAVVALLATGCDEQQSRSTRQDPGSDPGCYRRLESRLAALSVGGSESIRMQLALDEARTRLGERIAACAARLEASGDEQHAAKATVLRVLLDEQPADPPEAARMKELRSLGAGADPPAVLAGLLAWQLARDAFVDVSRLSPDDPQRGVLARFALLGVFDRVPQEELFTTDFGRALTDTLVANQPGLAGELDQQNPAKNARLLAAQVAKRSSAQLLRIARAHPDSVWAPAIERAWDSFEKQHPREAAAARKLAEQ